MTTTDEPGFDSDYGAALVARELAQIADRDDDDGDGE